MTEQNEMEIKPDDIKIGDECRMKGETEWYKVQDVTIEEIHTIHKGILYFIRVYFGYDDHRPVWAYEIEEVRSPNDNS